MQQIPMDGAALGEIMMRGNSTMKGYYKNPRATNEAFKGGYFHTGDIALQHPDSYIQIADRAKDIIISGGENVSSVEVEGTLMHHPAVLLCAVVAKPDDKWGEVPCAFVELKEGATADEAELIAFARQRLAGSRRRNTWCFRSFPRPPPARSRSSNCARPPPGSEPAPVIFVEMNAGPALRFRATRNGARNPGEQMTVLEQYRRLESLGLWRDGPDDQRREVVVSLGEATLVVSTPSETALTHWSLPAIERLNPGRTPALYAPGAEATGTAGDRRSRHDCGHRGRAQRHRPGRPHPGRLRWMIGAAAALAVLAGAVFWLPGALTRQTVTACARGQARGDRRGASVRDRASRGPPCAAPRARVALARLSTRVLGTPPRASC
jgi:hypothetical protein